MGWDYPEVGMGWEDMEGLEDMREGYEGGI